jgi:hypothetical protein
MAPAPVALFDLLQFLALLFCEVDRHLPVLFHDDLVNASAGVAPHLLKLGGRLIDDGRYFDDLFRRQIQLRTEPFLHPRAYHFRAVKFREEKMASVKSSKEDTGNAPGDKDEDESRNELPLQRAAHLKTHPGSQNPRSRIHSSRNRRVVPGSV